MNTAKPQDSLTQANDLFHQGNVVQAKMLYEQILASQPNNYGALNGRGMILAQQGNLQQAIKDFKRVIELCPNPATFSNLGKLYTQSKLWNEATNCFEKSITLDNQFTSAYYNYGKMFIEKSDLKKAIEYFEKAISVNPEHFDSYIDLGSCYMILGDKEQARLNYKKIIEINPSHTAAYHDLSTIEPLEKEEIKQCEQLLTQLKNEQDLSNLHFALGSTYAKLKDFDRAFEHYESGNQILSKLRPFDRNNFTSYINNIIATYDKKFFSKHKFNIENHKQPIFIIGLPRTGSTLIEQILTSHSDVHGIGELGFFDACITQLPPILKTNAPYPECTKGMTEGLAKRLVDEYYRQTGHSEVSYIVDKSLTNFQHLGIISILFPYAKIINCTRNPMDMATSMYSIRFTNGNAFSNSFENIAFYYQQYKKLMQHWKQVLPLPIYDIHYDDFIELPKLSIESMFEFIEIEAEKQCFSHDKNDRAVKTASVMQVRRPIYKASKERWRKYEKYIVKYQELFEL